MLPNFLIIGATKGGTTSVHHYLNQHPEIFLCPRKETNFFAQESALCFIEDTIKTQEDYEKQFDEAGNAKVIGESSPAYLAVPDAPKKIHALIPGAKLIAILRDPAERAYSHFLMRRRQGHEFRSSFEQCLDEDDIDPLRSYKSRGFYGEQIERYLKYFRPEQMKLFLYEELKNDPKKLLREIFVFLDVDTEFNPNISERYNENPRSEPLTPDTRKGLIEIYREDMVKLRSLTGLEISAWMGLKKAQCS